MDCKQGCLIARKGVNWFLIAESSFPLLRLTESKIKCFYNETKVIYKQNLNKYLK